MKRGSYFIFKEEDAALGKKIFITILISMLISATGYSYELFINSDPINASVYSGEKLLGKTPMRLHDIKFARIPGPLQRVVSPTTQL